MALDTVKIHLNGQSYNLSYVAASKMWEATITAPSTTSWHEEDNKYGLTVTAKDIAGNVVTKDRSDISLGSKLQIRVLEKIKPTVTLTTPSSGARLTTAKPIIKFKVKDTHSGIDISTLSLKLDNGVAISNTSTGMVCTSTSDGYDCVYTPQTAIGEGSHTLTIQVKDNDKNISTLLSSGFVIDTIPPALNISSPINNLVTNQKTLAIIGTSSDVESSPVVITITVNSKDQGGVSLVGSGFNKSVTLSEGSNTVIVTATDASGLKSTVTRTIMLDTVDPIISEVTITPNPVDAGATFIISVKVSD